MPNVVAALLAAAGPETPLRSPPTRSPVAATPRRDVSFAGERNGPCTAPPWARETLGPLAERESGREIDIERQSVAVSACCLVSQQGSDFNELDETFAVADDASFAFASAADLPSDSEDSESDRPESVGRQQQGEQQGEREQERDPALRVAELAEPREGGAAAAEAVAAVAVAEEEEPRCYQPTGRPRRRYPRTAGPCPSLQVA